MVSTKPVKKTELAARTSALFAGFVVPRCEACPFALNGVPRHKPVLATFPLGEWKKGKGAAPSPLPLGTLLGEGPGPTEVDVGAPFVGRTGMELDDVLATAGIRRTQILVINATACRPPPGMKAVEMRHAARCCRPLLRDQLKKAYFTEPMSYAKAPTLAVGSLANYAWHKLFKNKKPPSVKLGRGFVRKNLIVTWHPTFAFFYDVWRRGEFEVDVARFGRLLRGEVKLLDSSVLHCQPSEMEIIRMLAVFGKSAAVDIETGPLHPDKPWTGKQPGYARLRTIGIGNEDFGFSISPLRTSTRALNAIRYFLRDASIEKVVMNGHLFDLPILLRHGFEVK